MSQKGQTPDGVYVWLSIASDQAAVRATHDLARGWVEQRVGDGEWSDCEAGQSVYEAGDGEETGVVQIASIPDAEALISEYPAGVER